MVFEAILPYFTIGMIFIMFFLIYQEKVRPAFSLLGTILIFIFVGVLSPEDLLAGFSNESIASIILLILITVGLRNNFRIEQLLDRLNAGVTSYRPFLIRMMGQVAILSSIINNTPVVAFMTPYIFNWGKRHNIAPSKLLIPLSFAAIFGGMITLIGTSTTLVLNGFLIDLDLPTLDVKGLFITGIAVTVTGILFLAFIGHRLLPDRKDVLETFETNQREYLVETRLKENSSLINQSILKGGLRNLKGLYLVEIIRNKRIISPVEPDEKILKDDILIFAGDTKEIMELDKSDLGIVLPKAAQSLSEGKVDAVEAVISGNSSLIGRMVRRTGFRNRYDAAIVAIHRNGEKITGKIGDVVLKSGDLLLLYAGNDFFEKVDLFRDIYIISNIREIFRPARKKTIALVIIGLLAIFFLAIGYFSLFTSLLIIFSIMAVFNMVTLQDVKREMDLNMISILVFSLAIGQAIIKTEAGDLIANLIIGVLEPYGKIAILCGLLFITTLMSSFITNVGAISIAFPLAYSLSNNLQMDGAPFYLAIAYAASAAFLTPISYQTNLIIYGPGGYSFKDFFKVGLPVSLVYLATTLICISLLYRDVLMP